jgi:hypothetical protein
MCWMFSSTLEKRKIDIYLPALLLGPSLVAHPPQVYGHNKEFFKGYFYGFFLFLCMLFNTASYAAPHIILCRRMMVSKFEPRTVATLKFYITRHTSDSFRSILGKRSFEIRFLSKPCEDCRNHEKKWKFRQKCWNLWKNISGLDSAFPYISISSW